MAAIEFEPTPNPHALRVLPGRSLGGGPPRQFDRGALEPPPLAEALLAIPGIVRVMIARDFVTLVREGDHVSWDAVRPEAAMALADAAEMEEASPPPVGPVGEIEQQIEDVLHRWVRPLLAADGGDAVLERFDAEAGIAWVRMEGACGGCPSGSITLKRGIEQAIRRWVPEVTQVREATVTPSDADRDPKARFRAWIAARWGRGD